MLTLPIKKKWFDMIKSGEKKEEYRDIKKYWFTRFNNNLLSCVADERLTILYGEGIVIFKNGYQKNAPKIICEINITTDFGKEEWGAEPEKMYYVLKILSVEEIC